VRARVTRVSADLTRDPQQAGVVYYLVRLALSDDQLKRLGDEKLLPGMPAEIYIQTEERTALSYVLKPLFDQVARAFKER
jgi:HlyD family secretion protein